MALDTVYVSGATRSVPLQRLRPLLSDLTGIHIHTIVDLSPVGSLTAVVLLARGVATFKATLAAGNAAGDLTGVEGFEP